MSDTEDVRYVEMSDEENEDAQEVSPPTPVNETGSGKFQVRETGTLGVVRC